MPKIAIIEDNEVDSSKMRELIESAYTDCEFYQYYNQAEAEAGLEEHQYKFDLLIVDVDLGGNPPNKYGGFAILAKLTNKPVVALVVSGKPDPDLGEMVITLKAYDFLSKPYSPAGLLNAVKHALEWRPLVNAFTNTLGFSTSLPTNLTWNTELGVGFKWKERVVHLSMAQLRLVICLVKAPGKVIPAEEMIDLLDTAFTKKAVATHINATRTKFVDVDHQFDQIANDPGKGYYWRV